ncbi:hypothetical protein [Actinomycetospora atypica]|uniref:Uncharacterized protein n=1 Tax=Actinomycetospora atypica TaxID=1290095 RepID=A0ABV9YIV4_9PSEU
MSRPDASSGYPVTPEPRLPRAQRTVHRRSAPVPLRVVSQRLTAADVVIPTPAPEPAASGTTRVAAPAAAPAPVATLDRPAPPNTALPVLAPRRRPFDRLLALVRGRRRDGCGRHRPDTIPSRGWSMFAPQRRPRRRFGTRR